MRKPVIFIVIVAVLAVGAIGAGVIYQRWHDSPRYALQQMVLSLKERDLETFFKYLDLKEIFNNVLEDSSRQTQPGDQEGDDFTRFSRQLGRQFARKIFPKLYDNFEKQIRGIIQSYLQDLTNTQILALTAAVTTARIEVKGDEALVTLYDPKAKRPLRLQMRRLPGGGDWRIVALNYEDFKPFLKKEFLGISHKKDNV
ncbi:MAG: hypothetical protein ACYDIC_17705 [Desulfobaccales bacterium]